LIKSWILSISIWMIIYFRFSYFLFKFQILLIKISEASHFIPFGSILVKLWAFKKGRIQKSQKRTFSKNYMKIWFFFSKNQFQGVKSVEEYNFNLFWHIYIYLPGNQFVRQRQLTSGAVSWRLLVSFDVSWRNR